MLIYGTPYSYNGEQSFRLLVHTGSSIKPGIYTSRSGQVGLALYASGSYPNYVSDSMGDLTVTINSVNNNIVTGIFTGSSQQGTPISSGRFACRVKAYLPYTDSTNKWKWTDQNLVYGSQLIYGGNIVKATKSKIGNQYYLTMDGESNNNTSVFKLTISSFAPIDTGMYRAGFSFTNPTSKRLDSLYFKPLGGGVPYFAIDGGNYNYCVIDTIDGDKVMGRIALNPPNSQIRKTGSFRGRFY